MNPIDLSREISAKNFDIEKYTQIVLNDAAARDEMVRLLCSNPDIMVYYHCFYVLSNATNRRPDLFYGYWSGIAGLLKHANSYHRDIALTLLANLTKVDRENKFVTLFHGYFEHVNDKKFMTGKCCVQNSLKIIQNQPEYKKQILAVLLDVDQRCTYPEKQKALLKYDVLDILDVLYAWIKDERVVDEFIQANSSSISPKTQRKAREMIKKYQL